MRALHLCHLVTGRQSEISVGRAAVTGHSWCRPSEGDTNCPVIIIISRGAAIRGATHSQTIYRVIATSVNSDTTQSHLSAEASGSKESQSRMCLSGRRHRSDSDSPDWSLDDLSTLASGGDHPSADQFRMLLNLLPPQSLAQVRDLDSIRSASLLSKIPMF